VIRSFAYSDRVGNFLGANQAKAAKQSASVALGLVICSQVRIFLRAQLFLLPRDVYFIVFYGNTSGVIAPFVAPAIYLRDQW
jgi:Na+-driven multidrug efflux pump